MSISVGGGAKKSFEILIVCTGNVCRSPVAEQLFRARFAALGLPAQLSSAGTNAYVGQRMTPEATALSKKYGGVPSDRGAIALTETAIAGADLVVTASREHRSEVVSLYPRSARYTFTLNQFARLTATAEELYASGILGSPENGSETYAALVASVAASRGYAPPLADPTEDDIVDPYGQTQDVYDRAGEAIDKAVRAIAIAFAKSRGDHDGPSAQ